MNAGMQDDTGSSRVDTIDSEGVGDVARLTATVERLKAELVEQKKQVGDTREWRGGAIVY